MTNLVGGDSLVVSGTGVLASKNAGSEALTSSGGALAGLGLSNANYTLAGGNGTVTINPLAVSLSGTRAYDGTTNAAGSLLTATNLVSGDSLVVSGTGVLASKNAGSEALTSAGGALAGLGLSNTNYTLTGGSGAVTINPLAVNVSGTRTYDGTTGVSASLLTVINLAAGDSLILSGAGVLASKNAGSEALTSSGGALVGLGLSNANYTLTGASGAVTIGAATLTYVADPASRPYGSINPAMTGSVTGFAPGDTLASATIGALEFGSGAAPSSNVGLYAIAGSGLTANNGNYLFVQAMANGTALQITPAALAVTGAKTADGTTAFTTAQLGVSGAVNGETLTLLSGTGLAPSAVAGIYNGAPLSSLTLSVSGGKRDSVELPAAHRRRADDRHGSRGPARSGRASAAAGRRVRVTLGSHRSQRPSRVPHDAPGSLGTGSQPSGFLALDHRCQRRQSGLGRPAGLGRHPFAAPSTSVGQSFRRRLHSQHQRSAI